MTNPYENTLFVVGGALDMSERSLRPYMREVGRAIGHLGITAEVLRVPRGVKMSSKCNYADPEDWLHRDITFLQPQISQSRGVVLVNPGADQHDCGTLQYAVSGIGSAFAFAALVPKAKGSSQKRLFVTHGLPALRGNIPADEKWAPRLSSTEQAVVLAGDYRKLVDALQ